MDSGGRSDIEPLRGQVLITERVERFLDLPTGSVRQTGDRVRIAVFIIISSPEFAVQK